MTFNKSFLLAILVPALALCSCYHQFPSGSGGGGTGGGGGGGNTETLVNLTVTSTPSQTFSFPSLTWDIGSVALIDSSGNVRSIVHFPLPAPDFARLQTDSLYLGSNSIANGSYTKLQIQLNFPLFSYFYNSSTSTLLGCAPATVCQIPSTVPGFTSTASPITVPITFSANGGNTGVNVNFDLSKAVTTASGMTFDFTQPGAITLTVLPPTSSVSSGIDTIQNFTGTVTATTSTTVSVQPYGLTANLGKFTMAATVEFDDPFNICPAPARFSCLAANQNVSIDSVLNSDGTLTAYEVEFLDPAPVTNELEGVIITPVTNNQFTMVLTNEMGTAGFITSSTVIVNLSSTATYAADPKNLGSTVSTTPLGFMSQSDLVMGQTVMIRGGTIIDSPTSVTNPTRVLLRYSSIGGTVQSPSGTIFTLSGVSPFLTNLTTNMVQVQTFANTTYDNITGFPGLTAGINASARGLYLNPTSGATQPLLAARVRTH
jgi:hypothetical protein